MANIWLSEDGERAASRIIKGVTRKLSGVMKHIHCLDCDDGLQVYTYAKTHHILHFKYLQ